MEHRLQASIEWIESNPVEAAEEMERLRGAADERDEAIELLRMAAARLVPLAPYDAIREFLDRERQ
jgi:ABC-type nitrate/sulfonate/bicarbonate transport system substrate-binding protein